MPNRAKLVLFNNNNTNRQVSSPLASSSSNSLLNSSNPTPSNALTTEPKLNMSLNASPTIQATKVGFNTSLNSIASQFKSNRLSACEPVSSNNPLVPTTQMSCDKEAGDDVERTTSEENVATTTVKDALEEAVHIYKNFIMTNTTETLNLSDLTSDQCKKLIEMIEDIEHSISSRSLQAKRQIRLLEKQSNDK